MTAKRIAISLVVVFLLSACTREDEKKPLVLGTHIMGLGSPVQLASSSTRIYLHDYFEHPERIESVAIDGDVEYTYMADSAIVCVTDYDEPKAVTALRVHCEGVDYCIPLFRSRSTMYRFTYEPRNENAREVALKGNFNGWNHKATPLRRADDVWVADLVLPPGLYEYLVVEDGREMLDHNNPDRKDNGQGGFNSAFQVGSAEGRAHIAPYGLLKDSLVFTYPAHLHDPLILWQNQSLDATYFRRRGDRLSLALPQIAKSEARSYVRIYGCDDQNRTTDILVPLAKGKVVQDAAALNRSDLHTWSMYFMMVDRFVNGDPTNDLPVNDPEILPPANYYGGDLAGVKQKIEDGYFNSLGTNTIWLSPIAQNPMGAYGLWDKGGVRSRFSGYHGYWPISSSYVDIRFGSAGDLRALTDAAHSKGANVILDYVANHVHQEHPVYQQHPEWATELHLPDGSLNTERWDEYRLTTWFDTFMPTLNLERPEVVEAMTDSALFWFENFPIDGFRHDATKHIPLGFWRTLTRKLKYRVAQPQGRTIYQIGETYGNAELIGSYIGSGLLDAQFDFNLYDAAVSAFAKNDGNLTELARVLTHSLTSYGDHHLMGNISGNQDRARFISYADGSVRFDEDAKLAGWTRLIEISDTIGYSRLAMLHAFNFTIPGVPVIYYGDEIGMPGGNDPDNRRMMRFDDALSAREKRMLKSTATLGRMRSSSMALLYGQLAILIQEPQALVYARHYFDRTALVLYNTSPSTSNMEVEIPEYIHIEALKAQFGAKYKMEGRKLSIQLPPASFEILTN